MDEIPGFTRSYSFTLYTSGKYSYMRCTVPVSNDINSNVTCVWNLQKFYISYSIDLPTVFPEIDD